MKAANKEPLIFERFPALRKTCDWIWLDTSPSPIRKIESFGHESLWIKMDGIVSSAYGGNKVRKLEFILAQALKNNVGRVVTMGGIGSNHCLATAIFCKKLGLKCLLLHFDQPVTKYVLENLLLFHAYGAEMIYGGSMFKTGFEYYRRNFLTRNDLLIYAGGTSPQSTLGIVNAVFELKDQVRAGLMPEPDYIFCPTASNGTAAGLALGAALAGMKTTVMAVRVGAARMGPLQLNTPKTLADLMDKTCRLIEGKNEFCRTVKTRRPIMLDKYFGSRYGLPTNEGNRALRHIESKENIRLEPVYSAKAFAAVLDFISEPMHRDKTILFWQTNNGVDLSNQAAEADYRELPGEFHRFFEGKVLEIS